MLEEVFRHRFALDYRHTADLAEYRNWQGPKVNYSPEPTGDREIWIPSGPFLFESGTASPDPEVVWINHTPALFPMEKARAAAFPFDLLAMGFFLLSRYEEYAATIRDLHGRFPSSASLAGRHGFLEVPLWDIWMNRFAGKLHKTFPGLKPSSPSFSFLPTFDTDQAWAFRHKPLLRQVGGGFRDLFTGRFSVFFQRLFVLAGIKRDPFDTFRFIFINHIETPLFFFLLADPGPNDPNHPPDHPAFQALIRKWAPLAPMGIHPSYRAGDDPALVKKEKERLEQITGRPILKSRQHFLRLRFPDTYRWLSDAGIEEDYSMGYADALGFRAGTSVPFRWYDLEKESPTSLLINPFQAMDVTLKKYLELSPEKAEEHLLGILKIVRQTGGRFCTIWHNSSFDEKGEWKGWTAVYLGLLHALQNPADF